MDYCIVGLGNPGNKYENTRHNVGFQIIDCLAEQFMFPSLCANKYNQSFECSGMISGQRVRLLKPQTFMNLSGESLIKLRNKLSCEKFLIIYDDFDLPLGATRFREKGSAGSHNGMKSIIDFLDSKNVPRIRVGIHPTHKIGNASNFVLGAISGHEQDVLAPVYKDIAKGIEQLLAGKTQLAIQTLNRKAPKQEDH